MFYQIFFSQQVEQSAIISNKHGIYELPQELTNDLKLRILRNTEISGESQISQNDSIVPCLSAKIKIFLKLAENS